MVKLEYRLIGDINYPILTKEFNTRIEALDWFNAQGNLVLITIESTGVATLNALYGMR